MYIVAGHFQFSKDSLSRAQECMNAMTSLGRTEPGIRLYTFYPDPHKPNDFFYLRNGSPKKPMMHILMGWS